MSLRNSSIFLEHLLEGFCHSRRAIAVLALVCIVVPAHAIDPHRTISQYARAHWGEREGFSGGSVSAIAQSADGYLWIGSEKGLIRFDGLSFQTFPSATQEALSVGPVRALVSDAQSNLWILLQSTNVLRFHDGKFEAGKQEAEFGITALGRKKDGTILLSSVALGTLTFNGQKFEILPSGTQGQPTPAAMAVAQGDNDLFTRFSWATGVASHRLAEPNSPVVSMAETDDGRIWLGTADKGLFFLRDGRISAVETPKTNTKKAQISSLLPLENGKLLVGTDNGIFEWDGKEISQANLPSSLGHADVFAMIRDRDSNIWIGTANGLVRVNGDGVAFEISDHGIGGPVTALLEDREGDIWVGRRGDIERLRDSAFVTFSPVDVRSESIGSIFVGQNGLAWFAPSKGGLYWLRNGKTGSVANDQLGQDVIYSITGRDNELWIGRQRGGLTHLRDDAGSIAIRTYTHVNDLAQNSVYVVYEGSDGAVWAGTLSAGVSEFRDGHFTNYTTANGLASNTVSSIEESADHTMWFGTPKGLSGMSKSGWRSYTTADGLPSDVIDCLFEDRLGTLWIGTADGLAFLNNGQIRVPRAITQVLQEPVFGIAEDRNGSVWVASASHVLQMKRQDLVEAVLSDASIREYGVADGLLGTDGVKRERSIVEDPQGQIWISTNRGISVVNPTRATVDPVPAIVRIQTVLADGAPLELSNPLQIPPGERKITFQFIGLSLADSERVRYRYKLDGFDKNWSEPVVMREASYANLPAGKYRFHVIASNSEGLWNSSDAAVDFQVEPTLWQTWWFRLGVLLCAGLATLAIHRLRVRQLTQLLNLRFEERLAERTRIAQDLHDTLLQGIYSASIHFDLANNRLQEESAAKPAMQRGLNLLRQVSLDGRKALRSLRSQQTSSDGLEHALSLLPKEFALPEDIDFVVATEGEPRVLRPLIRDEAYLIAREAIINAFRHARATRIEVEVDYASRNFRIFIRDNGCGIAGELLETGREGHWGLPGMRERAEKISGTVEVLSRANAGTEVQLSVPGPLAFQDASTTGQFWKRLLSLYPEKRRSKLQKASEGQQK